MSVALLVYLPADVYRTLTKTATKKECQVHTLIETALTRTVRGEAQPRKRPRKPIVRLAPEERVELARLHREEGWTSKRLAEHYDVSRPTADNIIREERNR